MKKKKFNDGQDGIFRQKFGLKFEVTTVYFEKYED